jgi:hypothetical protein
MLNRDLTQRLAKLRASVASARREIEILSADRNLPAEMRKPLAEYADALDNASHLLASLPGHRVLVRRVA